MDATKAFPICIKPTITRLPKEKKDWPEQLMPYLPSRCQLTKTEGVIRSGDRTITPANLSHEDLNTPHAGHAAVTTMLTKTAQEVIAVKTANRPVTGNLGPQHNLHTNRFARALPTRTPTPLPPSNPTHRRGPHSKASPTGDPNPPPRLLLPGARLQGSSCHGLQQRPSYQAPQPTSKLLLPWTPHWGCGTITLLKRHQSSRNLNTLNENEKTLTKINNTLNENEKTLNEIKDTPNENKKTLNEIELPEAFASN